MGFSGMSIFSGGLSNALQSELGNVQATPPRQLGSEISQILGQNGQYYDSAANWNPQYQQLAIDLYGQGMPQINSILNQANSATRSSTAGDLASLGAGVTNSIRGFNPSQTGLYDKLVTQANQGLDAGSRLSPDQQFSVSNPIRSDWAQRGFGESLPGDLNSAVALSRAGDNMQGQRQAFAGNVAEMGNRFYSLPTLSTILGTGSNAAQNMGAVSNTGADATQGLLGYGSDLFNTNYNEEAARNIADYNGRAGLMGTALSY